MFIKANRDWLVIAYIPLRGKHITQPLHLRDTRDNRRTAQQIKKALEEAMHAGTLEAEFAKRFPASKPLPQPVLNNAGRITLGQYGAQWLEEKTQLTEATRYDYQSIFKTDLFPHPIASEPLADIDDGAITRFINEIAAKTLPNNSERKISHRRVNMVIARLRTLFATAYRRKLIATDPMRHVQNLRQRRPEVDPFDLDETRRIIDAARLGKSIFRDAALFRDAPRRGARTSLERHRA